RLPCSADRSCLNLGTPFFPLVESGFQCLGPQGVENITELKLGAAEQLAVLLAGEEAGDLSCFAEESALQKFEDSLGFGFLFDSEQDIGHGEPPCRSTE